MGWEQKGAERLEAEGSGLNRVRLREGGGRARDVVAEEMAIPA